MSTTRNYIENSKEELGNPELYLPTYMVFIGRHPTWTKPAYATFRQTKTPMDFTMHDLNSPDFDLPRRMEQQKTNPNI